MLYPNTIKGDTTKMLEILIACFDINHYPPYSIKLIQY